MKYSLFPLHTQKDNYVTLENILSEYKEAVTQSPEVYYKKMLLKIWQNPKDLDYIF